MFTSLRQRTTVAASATPAAAALTTTEVLLVDDHPAVRLGARLLIDDQPDMRVAAQAASADEALSRLARPIEVAVVDYHLGHGRDGLWLTTRIKSREPAPRVLVYSAFADGALAVTARIAGADGLLDKHELGQELCHAIRRLAAGQCHLPAIRSSVAQAMRSRLEPREQAVFGMLLHGTAPDVIAERLGITGEELEARRSSILSAFRPDPGPAFAPPAGARAPLDYERPRRRTTRLAG